MSNSNFENINNDDRLAGLLYGYSIGDALGIGTEFMSRNEVLHRYPKGLGDYSDIIRDAHRSQFEPSDWTMDTEIMLALVHYLHARGDYDLQYLARTLVEWFTSDVRPDAPNCIRFVIREPGFIDNPLGTANKVWKKMGRFEASNEALHRALIFGLWPKNHIEHAIESILLTHANSRCAASGAVIAHMVHEIFYNNRIPDLEEAIRVCEKVDTRSTDYVKLAYNGAVEELKLDDSQTYWYTRKTMSIALWCLWHSIRPVEALDLILSEGGDANTNAANTIGLLGLLYGKQSLPEHLCNGLRQKQRLDKSVSNLQDLIHNLNSYVVNNN